MQSQTLVRRENRLFSTKHGQIHILNHVGTVPSYGELPAQLVEVDDQRVRPPSQHQAHGRSRDHLPGSQRDQSVDAAPRVATVAALRAGTSTLLVVDTPRVPWFSRRFERATREEPVEVVERNRYGGFDANPLTHTGNQTVWQGPTLDLLMATWLTRWESDIEDFRIVDYQHNWGVILYQTDRELD